MKRSPLIGILLLLGAGLFVPASSVSCLPPLLPPATLNPLPSPDAGPPDSFTAYIADCSDSSVVSQKDKATTWIIGCNNFSGGYDTCMVKGLDNVTKDAIVCTVVDLNVAWQRQISMGTATDIQKACAQQANTWIRNHRVGVRR